MLPFSFFLLLYRFRFSLSEFWYDFLSLSFLPSLIPSPVLLMQIMNSVPRPELGVKMVTWTCTNFKLKWMIRLIFFLPCIFYISHSHTHKKCVCPPTKKRTSPRGIGTYFVDFRHGIIYFCDDAFCCLSCFSFIYFHITIGGPNALISCFGYENYRFCWLFRTRYSNDVVDDWLSVLFGIKFTRGNCSLVRKLQFVWRFAGWKCQKTIWGDELIIKWYDFDDGIKNVQIIWLNQRFSHSYISWKKGRMKQTTQF